MKRIFQQSFDIKRRNGKNICVQNRRVIMKSMKKISEGVPKKNGK